MKLQNKLFGIDTREAYNKIMADPEKENKPLPTKKKTTSTNGVNLADYVLMPEHNLYVAKERIYQDCSWYKSHESLHQENARMLTIRAFVDFLSLLRTGNVLDGLEQRLPGDEAERIYKDITEIKNSYRAEWLDADFKVVDGKLHINYNHRTVNGNLQPQNSEPLESCVMENKTSGIDLESWLKNANRQGLPPTNIKNGSLNYWAPMKDDNSVAWFVANSDGALLSCYGSPAYSISSLGVRAAREK